MLFCFFFCFVVFFQAEDGIRDLVRSRGLGDVYKRQPLSFPAPSPSATCSRLSVERSKRPRRFTELIRSTFSFACFGGVMRISPFSIWICLLYTSDAADERSSVDLGGRRILKKKNKVVL